jgi:hypothetical protein
VPFALRILFALAVLAGLVLVALAVLLPRLVSSDAVRGRIEKAAREATGQEVRWEALDFGLFPPRLVVKKPQITDPRTPATPSLEARNVDLRVAFLPLLARTVVIDSLVVEGVTVRLKRTAQGLELPIAAPAEAKPSPREPEPEGGTSVALAVGELTLRDSRLLLEDRTVSPPVSWDITDLEAHAKGSSLDGPIDVKLSGSLASGGTVQIAGTAWLDGRIDLGVDLERVVLAPLGPYLGPGQQVAGELGGHVEASGPAASPTALEANLTLEKGDIDVADLALRGHVKVRAEIEGGIENPSGRFEIDATDADVAYGVAFTKPRGKPGTVSGRLVPGEAGGIAAEEVRIQLADLQANGRLRSGDRSHLELDAKPFPLAGWGEMVPAAEPYSPQGRVGLEKLSIATPPLELRGRILLDAVTLHPPGREPVALSGAFEGFGSGLRSSGLEATVADQMVSLDVEVTDLATTPRYRVQARTEEADANSLVTAMAGMQDTLYGLLTADAEISAAVGGDQPPLQALSGQARIDLGKGKLRGVSLLRSSFGRLGAVGEAALLIGSLRGGKTLQRFYGDDFESVSGTFKLRGGMARTNDLKLIYQNYTVDLRGSLGLISDQLDFTGTITIDEEVDAALQEGSTEGAATPPARSKVIPLAHVGGTLSAPRVDLSREVVLNFAATYAASKHRTEIEQKIDERLGEGAGREVLDTLQGILGGKRKP